MKVAAKDLRPGDLCRGSNQLILWVQPYGVNVPAGKVAVGVEWPGKQGATTRYWNRETRIGVDRSCESCGGDGVSAGPDSFGNYDPCDDCEGTGLDR